LPERFPIFYKLWVDRNAGHGADLHALGLVKMTHTLGAFLRINLVDLGPQKDGLVRALGLADITIDALVSDDQGHGLPSTPVNLITLPVHMVRIIRALAAP
jgi:hypothetical protein